MPSAAPTFCYWTEVDVEVDVPADELEREGWVYVGNEADPPQEHVIAVVRRWHDETHPDPWCWCRQGPCRDLNRIGETP